MDPLLIAGTGGIGWGQLFRLEGRSTLGRNESRAAALLPARDFCKLHIILHYPARLLGRSVRVVPVGRVGDDDPGRRLVAEMRLAGMDTSLVRRDPAAPTLYSTCFLYPNGDGGNLTAANSASARVSPADVRRLAPRLRRAGRRGVVLAAPEVPLAARAALLALGTRYGAFRAAGFTAAEAATPAARRMLRWCDVVSLNLEEATTLAGLRRGSTRRIVAAAVRAGARLNPAIRVAVTAGPAGAYGWEAGRTAFVRAPRVRALNTAGAGDAFLGGLLVAQARGLPFLPPPGLPRPNALAYAASLASLKVTGPDTIHHGITPATLASFTTRHGRPE